jgi:general secretion pathway protein J
MKRQRGFTLLEIVIAMTLTAMLLGMLSAGLYSVVNDWKRETSSLDSGLDQALSVLQLDRALQAAFPHTYVDPERLARFVYFEGEEDRVRFVSTVSPQRESAMMAWQLTSSRDDGVQLTLTPAFSDNPNARLDELTPVALLPHYTAELRYLVQKNSDTKEWLDKWDGSERQSLPIAVHIKFTPIDSNSKDKEQVLEIVAPIRGWRNPEIEPLLNAESE